MTDYMITEVGQAGSDPSRERSQASACQDVRRLSLTDRMLMRRLKAVGRPRGPGSDLVQVARWLAAGVLIEVPCGAVPWLVAPHCKNFSRHFVENYIANFFYNNVVSAA